MSRDRRIITRKRNKLTIVAVAGALSVATAASAAAAIWPAGPPAGKAGTGGTAFATLNQPVSQPADHQPSLRDADLAVAHFRAAAGHQAMLTARVRRVTAPSASPSPTSSPPRTGRSFLLNGSRRLSAVMP